MAGGNGAKHSNRIERPKRKTFMVAINQNSLLLIIFRQFHAVTALRFVPACHQGTQR
jgi:hypothetical protein